MPRKKVEEIKPVEQFEVNWDKIKEQVKEAQEMVDKGLVKPAKKEATKEVKKPAAKKAATKEAAKPATKKSKLAK